MSEQQPADAVDLSALIPIDTADLHIVAPGTNERTGWVITFAGPGHPKTIAINNETSRKQLEEAKRIKQAQANGRKYKADDVQPEESRREFIEGLVARMVAWTPVKIGAETFEFSDKVAVDLLLRPVMGAFVSQIVEFLIDERTFTKDSANS